MGSREGDALGAKVAPDATLLLKAGVPIKLVNERLRHTAPGFTKATYQRVIPVVQEVEAACTFAVTDTLLADTVKPRYPGDTSAPVPG